MEISIKWAICRVCLREEGPTFKEDEKNNLQMFNIFSEKETGRKLADYIYRIGGVEVQPDDGLPQKICMECSIMLKNAIRFRATCQKSNKCLQSVLKRTKFTKLTEVLGVADDEFKEQDDDMISLDPDGYTDDCVNDNVYTIGLSGDRIDADSNITIEPKNRKVESFSVSKVAEPKTISDAHETLDETGKDRADDEDEYLIEAFEANPMNNKCFKGKLEYDEGSNSHDAATSPDEDAAESVDSVKVSINSASAQQPDDSTSNYLIYKDSFKDDVFSDAKTYVKSTTRNNDSLEEISFCIFNEDSTKTNEKKSSEDELEQEMGLIGGTTTLELSKDDLLDDITHSIDFTQFRSLESKGITRDNSQQSSLLKRRQRQRSNYVHCEICGNQLASKSVLRSHMRIHLQDKQFECEICGKKFSAPCNLTAHMRVHTGEKPFKCNHCGRCFSDKSTLIKHERTHTNERPYACNVCDKRFSLTTSLKAHTKVHTGEKPFSCSLCKKSFKLPHQLKAHKNSQAHKSLLDGDLII